MPTFVVSMQPNVSDGRRKTTKITADEVARKGDWVTFSKVTGEDPEFEHVEVVAEFHTPESWILEEVAIQGPRPTE